MVSNLSQAHMALEEGVRVRARIPGDLGPTASLSVLLTFRAFGLWVYTST